MDHDLGEAAGVQAASGCNLSVTNTDKRSAVLVVPTLLVVHPLGLAPSRAGQARIAEPFGSAEGGGLGLLSRTQGQGLAGGVVEHGLLACGVKFILTLAVPVVVVPCVILVLRGFRRLGSFVLCGSVIGAFEASDEVLLVPRNGKVTFLEQLLELRHGHAAEIVRHLDHSFATR